MTNTRRGTVPDHGTGARPDHAGGTSAHHLPARTERQE